MSVFISDIDTAEIYVQFFRPTTNLNINARMSWVVSYESLNTKKKSSWVIPKVVAVACESFSSQCLSQILNGVFTKAVVTRATRFFFYKNLFYKNVEAEIDPNFKNVLRTFLRLRVD